MEKWTRKKEQEKNKEKKDKETEQGKQILLELIYNMLLNKHDQFAQPSQMKMINMSLNVYVNLESFELIIKENH